MAEKKREYLIAPDYPGPLEFVGEFLSRAEANVAAWEWRGAGFYANVRRFAHTWRLFVREGRMTPAPTPKNPTLNALEQGR